MRFICLGWVLRHANDSVWPECFNETVDANDAAEAILMIMSMFEAPAYTAVRLDSIFRYYR